MKILATTIFRQTPSFKGEMHTVSEGEYRTAGYGENGLEDVYEPGEYYYYPYLNESEESINYMLKSKPSDNVHLAERLPYDEDTKDVYMLAKLMDKNTLSKAIPFFMNNIDSKSSDKYKRIKTMLANLLKSKND